MKRFFFLIIIVSLFFFNCTPVWAFKDIPAPTIVGNYRDNYTPDSEYLIGDTQWLIGPGTPPLTFTYTSVDNQSQVIIAENTFNEGDGFNFTGKFSQFNWVNFDNALWYCQIVYDAETEEKAANHPSAARSNPSEKGSCGNFAWTKLIRK